MRWFVLLISTFSLLLGTCAAQMASCTYSIVCSGTQLPVAPFYFRLGCSSSLFGGQLKGSTCLINDMSGPLVVVRYSQRVQMLNNSSPQLAVWDSGEISEALSCVRSYQCGAYFLKISIDSHSGNCPCNPGSQYQNLYTVGSHWDAAKGFTYSMKTSPFNTAK